MHVGVLGGTGPAGRAVAARLAAAGNQVTIGSRVKDRAQSACDDLHRECPSWDLDLHPADNLTTAEADLVVVATPWEAAASTAAAIGDRLGGKVLVSIANALVRLDGEFVPLALPRGSVAATVQAACPSSMVVAALNHLPARDLGDLSVQLDADVLVCSDHPAATATVIALLEGVPGLRGIDAGRLSAAGPIESLTPVLLGVNSRYRSRASLRITGIDGR
jgi:NADPH-dependent F420 reductase